MKNFDPETQGIYDVLLNEDAQFVHQHDDRLSSIEVAGQTYVGPSQATFAQASAASEPVVQVENVGGASRRGLLRGMGLGGLLMGTMGLKAVFSAENAYAQSTSTTSSSGSINHANGHTLVVVFLRGGWDSVGSVIPLNDDSYSKLRPGLGLNASTAVKLPNGPAGAFGVHPGMAVLANNPNFAVLHATGHPDASRSHFDKQAIVETGAAAATLGTGWLGRYLASTGDVPTYRGVSLGNSTALMIANPSPILSVQNLGDYNFGQASVGDQAQIQAAMSAAWAAGGGPMAAQMGEVINAVVRAGNINAVPVTPGVSYNPGTQRFAQAAKLIKSGIGTEAIVIDDDGWDMHGGEGNLTSGILYSKLKLFSDGLNNFWNDLGPTYQAKTTVVVLSEFGRRVASNASDGTDHGYGGSMMVLDSAIKPGVHGRWPGLAPSQLDMGGDLAITTDYRDLIAEVLMKRMGATQTQVAQSLPSYSVKPLGMLL